MSNGKHGLHTSLVAYIQSAVPFTCKMNKIVLAAEAELQAADTDRSKMRFRSKMSSITVLQSSLPFSSQAWCVCAVGFSSQTTAQPPVSPFDTFLSVSELDYAHSVGSYSVHYERNCS